MIVIGLLGNSFGRKIGLRLTASFMLLGAIIIVAAAGDPTTLFIVFNIGLAVLAAGVGGEYPLTSSSAAEHAEDEMRKDRKGVLKGMAFAMQGWGNFANTLVLFIIVAANGAGVCIPGVSSSENNPACSDHNLNVAWRVSYAVGLVLVIGVVAYRFLALQESRVWLERQEELKKMDPSVRARETRMARSVLFFDEMYSSRLFACCICWYGELIEWFE